MQLDKETLVKHHFWILSGLVLPLVLVVVIILFTAVADATETKRKTVENAEKSLKAITQPKNDRWLTKLGEKEQALEKKKDEVWKKAWQSQAAMYTWPDPRRWPLERRTTDLQYFGGPIDNRDRNQYKMGDYPVKQQKEIIALLQPPGPRSEPVVQWGGPPEQIVPTITKWTSDVPTTEDIWLAQEDLWVLRELVLVVKEANESVGIFQEEKTPPGEKDLPRVAGEYARKSYTNPHWKVDLVLSRNAQNQSELRGRITNVGQQKQPLGFALKVRLKPRRADPAARYRPPQDEAGVAEVVVDGEPVAVAKSAPIKSAVVERWGPEGLFGVEQVLTPLTVPVKRIDRLALGAQSHRTANRALKPGPASKGTDKPPEGTPGGTTDASHTGSSDGGMSLGVTTPGRAPGESGGQGQPRNATRQGLDRNRYLDVTESVRRMPVGLLLLVDQAHIPNVLAACANSPLRIQVTQVHWQHVRESLKPGTTGPGSLEGPPGPPGLGPAGRLPGPGRESGTPEGLPGSPPRAGMGLPTGALGGEGSAGRGTAPASAESEEEDPNLVRLAVYGIASLYERYPPRKPAEGEQARTEGTTTAPSK